MAKVLIITAEQDATIEYFMSSLSSKDREDIVHYKTDCPKSNQLVISPTASHKFELHTVSHVYNEEDFKSIYYRRTIPPNFDFQPPDLRLERYCEEEYTRFWESLEYCFPEKTKWFPGKPSKIAIAKNKLLQLVLAKDIGLSIPETVMTNRPEVLNNIDIPSIYKSIKSPNVPLENKGYAAAWTTEIDESIKQHGEGLLTCPGIIQSQVCHISYKVDIRVTIIGDSIFAAESRNLLHIDGRLTNAPYYKHILPNYIEARLFLLVDSLSLNFGAIDLIYDQNSGIYWFLEINSNGQWVYIEEETSMPLCKNLRNFLWNSFQ